MSMKCLLFLLLLLPLSSCSFSKYSSMREAKRACIDWAREGESFLVRGSSSPRYVRNCWHEKETRQYLGGINIDFKKIKKSWNGLSREAIPYKETEYKKYFKY